MQDQAELMPPAVGERTIKLIDVNPEPEDDIENLDPEDDGLDDPIDDVDPIYV